MANGILSGLSTDTKPTAYPAGTRYFETDTGVQYYWNGTTWLVTGDGTKPAQDYNYLVYQSGGTTYVKNGLTERIDHSGVTTSTEIQWALDNLSAGRTWKETLVLHGNITNIATRLDIPSYTKLVIDGYLKQADGTALAALLRNKNYGVTQQSNIEVCGGGTIDGNVSSGASSNGLVLYGVTDQLIHDLAIQNFGGPSARGLYVGTNSSSLVSRRISVSNIIADNCFAGAMEIAGTGDGLEASSVREINISNCIGKNSSDGRGLAFTNVWYGNVVNVHSIDNIGGTGRGFDIGYGSYDNTLTNCYATGSSLDGFAVADSPTALPADRTHFVNCYAIANTQNGFSINANECTVVGGASHRNGFNGFRCDQNRNTIIGLKSKNNSQNPVNTWSGFDIRGDNCVLIGCIAWDDQGTKTQRFGAVTNASADGTIIMGCQLSGNIQVTDISDNGTNTIVSPNQSLAYEDLPVSATAPANPGTGKTRRYTRTIDANNDGLFVKRKINGVIVEVQL